VKTLVIDASIAVKWVVEESGTVEALTLRRTAMLVAPDLLVVECANILWKKFQRREMSKEETLLAARLLQGAEIELVPSRSLLEAASRIAIELDHPAYDCLYLALAIERDCRFVIADGCLLRKVGQQRRSRFRHKVIGLATAGGRELGLTLKAGSSRSRQKKER
jgi:predicted nucleic acid-binding protein